MKLVCATHPRVNAAARCVICGIHLCETCRCKIGVRNYCRGCKGRMHRSVFPGSEEPAAAQASAKATPSAASAAAPAATPKRRARRSPTFAALLALVPGLGQAYAGRWMRGFLFFGIALALQDSGVPALLACFLYAFNLFDAYRVTNVHNDRRTESRRDDKERARDHVDDNVFTLAGLGVLAFTFFQAGGFDAAPGNALVPLAAVGAALLIAQETRE